MNNLLDYLKRTLRISRQEAKGTLVLFALILGVWLMVYLAEKYFSHSEVQVSIVTTERLDSLNKERRTSNFYPKKYSETTYYNSRNIPVETFDFDPNLASITDLQRLGIPDRVARNMDKYRAKGGKFKYKEDLTKMYGFPLDVYERLEASILLPSKEDFSVETPQAEYSGSYDRAKTVDERIKVAPEPSGVTTYKPKPKTIESFDLNKADTAQLSQIRGIGKVTAERIVKFRDQLGGFYDPEQVRETYNLPPETADELLKYAVVKSSIKKVNVNTIQLKDFRHPALSYNQRKALVNYREQHGAFKSLEDLKKIRIIDESTINKFAPYVEF